MIFSMGYGKEDTLILRKLGSRIRRHREAMGWSQEEFAFQPGLHRNYIGGVERGERNVAALNLVKISKALGVPVGTFFSDDPGVKLSNPS